MANINKTVLLKNVRLRYSDLWEPREYEAGDGKLRYQAVVIVEPGSENDKKLNDTIVELAEETCGKANYKQVLASFTRNPKGQLCYKDGAYVDEELEGMMAFTGYRYAANNPAPILVDLDGRTQLVKSSGRPYNGCYVNIYVQMYIQEGKNPGLRGSFGKIQFAGHGDAFASNSVDNGEFEDLSEGKDAGFDDVTAAAPNAAAEALLARFAK